MDISKYADSFATLLVGLVAFLTYLLTKRHERQNAAAIIIMDIRHAEQAVLSLVERGLVDRNIKPILHENNWAKYKHLFASRFSYDDLAALNRFFDSCVEIAEARKRMNESFYASINAKAALLQEKILMLEDLDSPTGLVNKNALITRFNNETYFFDPMDPKTIVLKNLELMGQPSTSTAFEKLKRIAKLG
jgi:hypothetical protein